MVPNLSVCLGSFNQTASQLPYLFDALAKTDAEVHAACANKETKTYDIYRHKFLRQTFVTIYVTHAKKVFDMHKHFVEGGGYTEHKLFVEGLNDP